MSRFMSLFMFMHVHAHEYVYFHIYISPFHYNVSNGYTNVSLVFSHSAEIIGIYKPGYHVLSGEEMDALQPHEIDNVIEKVSCQLIQMNYARF